MADEKETDRTTLTKLTLKGMGCKPQIGAAKATLLAHIYGYANGIKHKLDASGNAHIALIGDFEGVNVENGEVFNSGILFLPAGLHDQLAAPFLSYNAAMSEYEELSAEEKKKATKPTSPRIEFGLAIGSQPASNPIGYSYMAKSLLPPAAADPLSGMRLAIANKTKQLSAPAKK